MVSASYLWNPPQSLIADSNVKAFMDEYNIRDYRELIKRSTEDIEWFWKAAAEYLRIEWFKPYEKLLDTSKGVEWAKWFSGGKLNVAHNVVDRHADTPIRDKVALIWVGENEEVERHTYGDLHYEVSRFANGLKSIGVGKGDTVALYMPMFPETVIGMLATIKVGAISVPIFSGFAPTAAAIRLRDSKAKALITADGYYRRGRIVKLKEMADQAVRQSNDVEIVIVHKRLDIGVPWAEKRDLWWNEVVSGLSGEAPCEWMDADDPALLLYTSGTTGKPKGALISHIGALLQTSKEIHFNLDLKDDDVFAWITDIGWMMGPWQIIGVQHLCGTHLIFEGAPDYPKPDRIWKMIEDFDISILGGSATVFRMLKKYGDEWINLHNLKSLRILGNTGEPIDPDTWMWLLKTVGGGRSPIINLSGGTEIFGCFLLPLPIMPLKPSTLGGPGLGMDIDVFDEDGKPIVGKIGHLVCRKPAPSMTRGFWKDPKRYIETYWSKWPKIWHHGDLAYIDEDGFWFLQGRVDDVIKVAGKRVGPAEVESILNEHEAVYESACIGLPHEVKGEEITCFVVLNPKSEPDDQIRNELREKVAKQLGKPFKPREIKFLADLPRTRSGKIMRRLVKAVFLGMELGDVSALENPESLKEIHRAR